MTIQPSTAQQIMQVLARKGITPGTVTPAHLAPVYAKLFAQADKPDFDRAARLLESLPAGGDWGTDPFAVIVETRPTPALAYVIANVHAQTGLPVQLFHGVQNAAILETEVVQHLTETGALRAVALDCDALDAALYNAFFMDLRFYEALAGRGKFLVFQTDALCCPGADYTLTDFLDYDYIGAVWETHRPVGLHMHGGCGGFSLRDWAQSWAAIMRFSARDWPAGEDGFFAFHLEIMGQKVAKPAAMGRFASQNAFVAKSFGAHLVRRLPAQAHAQFLAYCPEIRHVLSWQREA